MPLVDPPRAYITAMAFSKAFEVSGHNVRICRVWVCGCVAFKMDQWGDALYSHLLCHYMACVYLGSH